MRACPDLGPFYRASSNPKISLSNHFVSECWGCREYRTTSFHAFQDGVPVPCCVLFLRPLVFCTSPTPPSCLPDPPQLPMFPNRLFKKGTLSLFVLESTTHLPLSCCPWGTGLHGAGGWGGVGPHSIKRGSWQPWVERGPGALWEGIGLGREDPGCGLCPLRQRSPGSQHRGWPWWRASPPGEGVRGHDYQQDHYSYFHFSGKEIGG